MLEFKQDGLHAYIKIYLKNCLQGYIFKVDANSYEAYVDRMAKTFSADSLNEIKEKVISYYVITNRMEIYS